jgi:hypothetical protein
MGVAPVSQKTKHDRSNVLKLVPVKATDLPGAPLAGGGGELDSDIVGLFTVKGTEIDPVGYTYAFVIVTVCTP